MKKSRKRNFRSVIVDELPRDVQDDIVANLNDRVPRLADLTEQEVRENMIGLVEEVRVLVGEDDPQRLLRQIKQRGRAVSPYGVAPLVEKLQQGVVLDPVLVDRERFVDGGHRVTAYAEVGRTSIPVVDIHGLLHLDWDRWLRGDPMKIDL